MNGQKKLMESLTIRVLIVLIAGILTKTGWDAYFNSIDVSEIAQNLAAIVLAVWAGYGRYRAKDKIIKGKK